MMEENLPPGFRFHPTDEELITCYLTRKVSDFSFVPRAIAVVDFNKCEPWDLPAKASMGEKEWYFFSLRDRKYPTGFRTNRATEAGYWKTTGKDKEITCKDELVGMKKTLVFYRGRAPKGEKSNWVMHEYRLETTHSLKANKEQWVVCRVFKKSSTVKTSQSNLSYVPLIEPFDDMTEIVENEHKDMQLPTLNRFRSTSSEFNNNNAISVQDYIAENKLDLNMMGMNNLDGSNTSSCMPSFPWTWSLLNPNLSTNSLLLKALQLRSYQQQREVPSSSNDYYAFLQQGGVSRNETNHFSSILTESSSKPNLEPVQQLQPQDQAFNDMNSINW